MSWRNKTRLAAVVMAVAGAGLVWGGSRLHGQPAAPDGAAATAATSHAPATGASSVATISMAGVSAASVSAATVGAAPVVGGGADLAPLTLSFAPASLAPGLTPALSPAPFSPAPGVIVPSPAGLATDLPGDRVAAIPLPPSAYPGMLGLATAAYAGWRYRRRRR